MKTRGWVLVYCFTINVIALMFLRVFSRNLDVYATQVMITMIALVISWAVACGIGLYSFFRNENMLVEEPPQE